MAMTERELELKLTILLSLSIQCVSLRVTCFCSSGVIIFENRPYQNAMDEFENLWERNTALEDSPGIHHCSLLRLTRFWRDLRTWILQIIMFCATKVAWACSDTFAEYSQFSARKTTIYILHAHARGKKGGLCDEQLLLSMRIVIKRQICWLLNQYNWNQASCSRCDNPNIVRRAIHSEMFVMRV